MVFHTDHDCGMYCKRLVAYVRIDSKWTPIGRFGTECKEFELLDLAKEEEEERLIKQRVSQVISRVKQSMRENKEVSQTCQDNELANLFGIKLKSFLSK